LPTTAHSYDEEAYSEKEGKMINSDFLNGLEVKEAVKKAIEKIEKKGIRKRKNQLSVCVMQFWSPTLLGRTNSSLLQKWNSACIKRR
jgi:hypothetical protein